MTQPLEGAPETVPGGSGERYVLALDQGTTSSRALLVNEHGAIVATAQRPIEQIYPQPGWVEHRPTEIWATIQEAAREVVASAQIEPGQIAAIGITNQRETVVMWDRATGEVVDNAIVWQDRRTAGICRELEEAGHREAILAATGLRIDPYFSGTKLAWMLREKPALVPRAEAGELAAGTIDTWLIWKLTGGATHATDFTNASRTMLFNVRRGRWDEELLGLLGVPASVLATPRPSRGAYGVASVEFLGAEIPILGVAGDQQSALFGQGCHTPGMAKNTYGTGCFLLANRGTNGEASPNGLLVSLGAGTSGEGPEYVSEGAVFAAGSTVQWLQEGLGIIEQASDVEMLAEAVPDTAGVEFVPAFTGLATPYWDPQARGMIIGVTRGTTRAHIARAALESIALQCTDVIEAMAADTGTRLESMRVDGGASRNNLLMQMQADFAGMPVVRAAEAEATALGAAHLAGIEAGLWASREEVAAGWRSDRTFEPRLSEERRKERLERWRRAVDRSRGWELLE